MKESFLTNWNAWRVIRLLLSIIFIIAGAVNLDYFLIAGGIFILYQAVFNTGCCAVGNCEVNYQKVKVKND